MNSVKRIVVLPAFYLVFLLAFAGPGWARAGESGGRRIMPVLFFYNPSCAMCAEAQEAVRQAEKKYTGKIKVLWYNLDDSKDKVKNINLYLQMLDRWKEEETPGTAVFAGTAILKDGKEIAARLFATIEAELAAGPGGGGKPKKGAAPPAQPETPAAAADPAPEPAKAAPADDVAKTTVGGIDAVGDDAPVVKQDDAAATTAPAKAEPEKAAAEKALLNAIQGDGDADAGKTGPEASVRPPRFRMIGGRAWSVAMSTVFFMASATAGDAVPGAVPAPAPAVASADEPAVSTWIDIEELEAMRNAPVDDETAARRIADRMDFFVISAAALGDGVNPCAFATVVLLVAMMTSARRTRREVLIMGVTFTFAVYITYFAIGLALREVLKLLVDYGFLTIADLIYLFAFGLCLVCGFFCLRDAWRVWRGGGADEVTLKLPDYLKLRIQKVMSKGVRSRSLAAGTFVAGVLVSALESACTGQAYFPILQRLSQTSFLSAVLWVGWYCLLFVLPLIIVFAAAYFGVTSQQLAKISKNNLAWAKLALGVVFLAMGAWLFWGEGGVLTRWPPGYRPGMAIAKAQEEAARASEAEAETAGGTEQ